MKEPSLRITAIWLAVATAAVLIAMVAVGMATGATQELHEHFMLPGDYALALQQHASGLRVLIALDIAFLVLYTAFFVALAGYLSGRPFVRIALAAMIATAVLDIIEDHHILAMLNAANHEVVPNATFILLQEVESATKFSMSYLGLVLFGLAIPRTTKLAIALALFLVVGTLIGAVIAYAVPPSTAASFASGQWIGFLVGLALAVAWLRQSPEA